MLRAVIWFLHKMHLLFLFVRRNTKKEVAVTKIKAEQKTSNEDLLHALVAHLRPQPLEIRYNKQRSLPAIMDRYHDAHEDEPEPKKLRAAASMLSLTSRARRRTLSRHL